MREQSRMGVKIKGQIIINDSLEMTPEIFGKVGAYVTQNDVLFRNFTPREALTFAARLKLKSTRQEQDDRVEELLIELGLEKCADVMIGSQMQKFISGGEKKRTAIGVQLITDPSVLILDEPTSSLDSFSALKMVKLLRD